jgi:hypothetical protein
VAVTIAKYATVYVQADSPKEAAEIVKNNLDDIYDEMIDNLDDQFEESDIQVDSYESYTTDAEDYMDVIWADGETLSYDEYMEKLEEQDKFDKSQQEFYEKYIKAQKGE